MLNVSSGSLGKAEVGHAGEALLNSVIAVGAQQFQGAQNTEFIEQITSDFVLATFAAVQCQLQSGDSVAARFQGQHAAIFVIRVRCSVHQAGCRVQSAQRELESDDAGVHR